MFAGDIHEDMSSIYPDESIQTQIINKHKAELLNDIVVIDSGIFLFILLVSYYIAGKTLNPIKENYEAQKNFIADASHNLRTPIAILTTDLEVSLLDGRIPKYYKNKFESYLEEVNNMKTIVEELLLLFRFNSNQTTAKVDLINIGALLLKCIDSLQSFANIKHVMIEKNNFSEFTVIGELLLLQHALRNVIKNAIEYSPEGGVVTIHMVNMKNIVQIRINNKGDTLSKNELRHVFERGYRSKKAKINRAEGTGLGLAITKEIIAKHNGRIYLTSSNSEGTDVYISIPVSNISSKE